MESDSSQRLRAWRRWLAPLMIAAWCLLLSSCVHLHRIYPNRLPPDFAGHAWHQSIREFPNLDYVMGSGLDASCYLPLPSQLSVYTDPKETYTIAGIKPERVEYFFYFRGILPRFGGSIVTFRSEEFDLDRYPNTPSGQSSYEQIRAALVAEYGPPHRGEIPKAAIKVTSEDDKLVVPSIFELEHYSWCGLGDPHAPKNCILTVVLEFEPLLGVGWVFYATPELRDILLEEQAYFEYSDDLFMMLYSLQLPHRMPLRLGCEADKVANRHDPFEKVLPEEGYQYSENVLDALAVQKGEARAVPPRHLSLSEAFDQMNRVVQGLERSRGNPDQKNYWSGYGQRIRYMFYADRYLSPELHNRWLVRGKVATQKAVRTFSQGYEDAGGLKEHPPVPSTVKPPNAAHAGGGGSQ
jgi:hypothetical protein